MKLIYVGKTIEEVGVVPLPEGWPALDHEEADEALAEIKLDSGAYREDGKSRRRGPRDETPEERLTEAAVSAAAPSETENE